MKTFDFEIKFYPSSASEAPEKVFDNRDSFIDMLEFLSLYHTNITVSHRADGISVLSCGEHIGNIKPECPTDGKIKYLHMVFANNKN